MRAGENASVIKLFQKRRQSLSGDKSTRARVDLSPHPPPLYLMAEDRKYLHLMLYLGLDCNSCHKRNCHVEIMIFQSLEFSTLISLVLS